MKRMQLEIFKWIGLTGIILVTNQVQESLQIEVMDRIKSIKDKIFSNYDKTIRPTNGTNTTDVYIPYFLPRQIIGLDEENSIFSLDSFLLMQWYDSRLEWNASDYDGYLQISKDFVWVPDISVYNSHSAKVDPTNDVLLMLHSSGYVSWLPPILTQTSCALNSTVPYPDDEIECMIGMGSWAYDGWEINFMHNMNLEWDEFSNTHSRWELLQSKSYVERKENYYECCPEPYVSIQAHFVLKRRPPPEIEATRIPCILTMILTLSIFWLPSESSKKLLLGGLLFLVLNTLLIYVAWSTKQPIAVLKGVSFLRTAMYILVMTIILEVFVTFKIASLRGPSRPPAMIIHILTGPARKYLFLSSPEEDQIHLTSGGEVLTPGEEWKMFASALDRVFFLITLLVMCIVHHL